MTPDELRARRERLGLSLQQLANHLGVHKNTIYKWEHGERKIPHLVDIALKDLERKKRRR